MDAGWTPRRDAAGMVVSPRWFVALALGLAAHAAPAHAAGWSEPVTLPGAQEQIRDRGRCCASTPRAAGRRVVQRRGRVDQPHVRQRELVDGRLEAAVRAGADRGGVRRRRQPRVCVRRELEHPDRPHRPQRRAQRHDPFKAVQANARSVSLAVNPAGDVLVAWTSDNTSDETGIVFWAHDKADPDARQLSRRSPARPTRPRSPRWTRIASPSSPTSRPASSLQTQSANAGVTPFGPPITLSSGAVGGMTGAQAPDGRAAIAWYEYADDPAEPVRVDQAVRLPRQRPRAGQAVHRPAARGRLRRHHRGLHRQQRGRHLPHGPGDHRLQHERQPGTSLTCDETIGEQTTRVAVAQITPTGEGGFAAQQLAGGGNVNSFSRASRPGRTAGWPRPGARRWAARRQRHDPSPARRSPRPEQPLSATVPGPPRFVGALAFLPDGRLAALSSTNPNASGPIASIIFDPSVPLVGDPPAGDPPPSTGTAARGPGRRRPPRPRRRAARDGHARPVKVRKGGTLRLTVKASGAGKLQLEAFAKKSLLSAARPRGPPRRRHQRRQGLRHGHAHAAPERRRPSAACARPGSSPVTLRLTFTPKRRQGRKPLTKKATLKR